MLLTKHKNECQQCQEEHSERHQVFKIEIIVHKHHLHSARMKVNHPVSRLPVAGATKDILSQYAPEHKFENVFPYAGYSNGSFG